MPGVACPDNAARWKLGSTRFRAPAIAVHSEGHLACVPAMPTSHALLSTVCRRSAVRFRICSQRVCRTCGADASLHQPGRRTVTGVPLYPPALVYQQLMGETRSRVNACKGWWVNHKEWVIELGDPGTNFTHQHWCGQGQGQGQGRGQGQGQGQGQGSARVIGHKTIASAVQLRVPEHRALRVAFLILPTQT